jgi:hypothetical protein
MASTAGVEAGWPTTLSPERCGFTIWGVITASASGRQSRPPPPPHPNPLPGGSLGERAWRSPFLRRRDTLRFADRLARILPLPKGEGRGEGERIGPSCISSILPGCPRALEQRHRQTVQPQPRQGCGDRVGGSAAGGTGPAAVALNSRSQLLLFRAEEGAQAHVAFQQGPNHDRQAELHRRGNHAGRDR